MEGWILIAGLFSLLYFVILPILVFVTMSRLNELKRELRHSQSRLEWVIKVLEKRGSTVVSPSQMAPHAERESVSTMPIVKEPAQPMPQAPIIPDPVEQRPASQALQSSVVNLSEEKTLSDPLSLTQEQASVPLKITGSAEQVSALSSPLSSKEETGSTQGSPSEDEKTVLRKDENAEQQDDHNPLAGLISWATHGNPLAKLGVLLLFFGLAYLIKFTVDHDLFPVELRLICASVLCLGLLGLGWRLRLKKTLYGLILQGGGVGGLYIVVFGTFRLLDLPSHFAFGLMLVICAASVVLAVLQRAQSLAVIASLGGYLAPILLSTGSANHIGLFSYYALLSIGILVVSIWQSWRPLNLIGFIFTFGVGLIWGNSHYTSEFYVSCQIFLALNLILFGILTVVTALRHEARGKGFIDASLLFGSPLVGFGMQYVITEQWVFGPAFAALVFAAVYLPLAYWIFRRWPREGLRLAVSFVALGGSFATLAIPLALSAKWTAIAWTLEGLGIVWAGLTQGYRRMSWSGSALLGFAMISALSAYFYGMNDLTFVLVFAILASSWLCAGWLWHTDCGNSPLSSAQSVLFWLGGIMLWVWTIVEGAWRAFDLSSWLVMLDSATALRTQFSALVLVLIALSACLWRTVGSHKKWQLLYHSTWLLWPVAAIVLLQQVSILPLHSPWHMHWWSLSWVVAIAAAIWLLRKQDCDGAQPVPANVLFVLHTTFFWGLLVLVGTEAFRQVALLPWGYDTWQVTIVSGCASVIVLLMVYADKRALWPLSQHRHAYYIAGLLPLLLLMSGVLFFANMMDGRMVNWAYLPLVNPLEESAFFAILVMALWARSNIFVDVHNKLRTELVVFFVAVLIWWMNGALLRALAFYIGLPWDFMVLWDSRTVQTTFALVWTLSALIFMIHATRQASRVVWLSGATLLGVVIIKLFTVDSAHGGGLARAIAFIGVAVLILIIGYFAPFPPKIVKNEAT